MINFLDKHILDFFVDLRSPLLNFIFLAITYAGGYMVATIVTALSVMTFYFHKHEEKALSLLVTILGTTTTVYVLKSIFAKARPLVEALYSEATYSFPSGHSAISIALYGFLFLNIYYHDPHHLKNNSLLMLCTLIILIGVSRLYLGVHFLSDVLFGYIVGVVWLYVGHRLSKTSVFH